MRIFTTRRAAHRAINNQAEKICHGLYTEGKPSPRELAEIVSHRWPDSALDGYSCAHHYLGHALSFPLHFLRAGTMASSPYFRSRRARRPSAAPIAGQRGAGHSARRSGATTASAAHTPDGTAGALSCLPRSGCRAVPGPVLPVPGCRAGAPVEEIGRAHV